MQKKFNSNNGEKHPFNKRKLKNKMILLDVGMEGCTACRWMDEITYNDNAVIKLVNEYGTLSSKKESSHVYL